jgi:RNA polymerase sigma-70 factor (ECF subfamily)
MALRVDDVDLTRDRTLVERFQAGDEAAFDDLYRRYFPRLYRFCLKRVGDRHEAEEVAQEAFTRAYRNLDRFGGERKFYPWVTVIAGRLCVDTHRRRARSQPSDEIDLGSTDGGQEAIVNRVDITLLRQAIDNLAPRHREVLDLREQQGYSYQRIADHYDVSVGTVEALLWRARKALRREFMALVDGDMAGAVPLAGTAGAGGLGAWVRHWARRLVAAGNTARQRVGAFAGQTAGAVQLVSAGVVAVLVTGGVLLGLAPGAGTSLAHGTASGVANELLPTISTPRVAPGRVAGMPTASSGSSASSHGRTTQPAAGGASGPPPIVQQANPVVSGGWQQGADATQNGVQVSVLGIGLGFDPAELERELDSAPHNVRGDVGQLGGANARALIGGK